MVGLREGRRGEMTRASRSRMSNSDPGGTSIQGRGLFRRAAHRLDYFVVRLNVIELRLQQEGLGI